MEFKITKLENSIQIDKYLGKDLNITIPEKIKGLIVTHIGNSAFYNNNLESVKLPKSIKHIGDYAFYNNNLESVKLPKSITHIGNSAFEFNNLESVKLPKSITHIGNSAFSSNKLESVKIPNSIEHIGDYAFEFNNLESVKLPKSIKHIGDYAFYNNKNLNKVIRFGKTINTKCVDGYIMEILNSKRIKEFTIYESKYLFQEKIVFVAEKEGIYAHGDSIKKAIEDCNFKFLQKNLTEEKIQELVREIKSSKIVTKVQYRLITGACDFGVEKFKEDKGIKEDFYELDKVLELVKGYYGGDKFIELIKN